jgi:RNA recognition motif-containing protein
VRNVDFKTTTEQLQTFFSQYGNTKEVRIVHHRTGKPKGFAYVEYFDEETAQKALAAHQQVFNGKLFQFKITLTIIFLGRTLQVYISDPSIGKQQKSERPSGPKPPKFNRGHANGKSEEPKAPVLGGGFARSSTGFSLKPRIVLNK